MASSRLNTSEGLELIQLVQACWGFVYRHAVDSLISSLSQQSMETEVIMAAICNEENAISNLVVAK